MSLSHAIEPTSVEFSATGHARLVLPGCFKRSQHSIAKKKKNVTTYLKINYLFSHMTSIILEPICSYISRMY